VTLYAFLPPLGLYLRKMVSFGAGATQYSPTILNTKHSVLLRQHHLQKRLFQPDIGAFGTLVSTKESPMDGYMVHPTITDASLHLGASLKDVQIRYNLGEGTMGTSHPIMRVPTKFGLYSCNNNYGCHAHRWANVGDLHEESNEAISSTYKSSSCNTLRQFDLKNLLAKPLRMGDGDLAIAKPSGARAHLMYELSWKATSKAKPAQGSYILDELIRWQIITSDDRPLWQASLSRKNAASAALVGLQVVRCIFEEASMEGGRCQLLGTMQQCSLGGENGAVAKNMTTAASLSLLKTAAQEHPELVWQATMDSTFDLLPKFHSPQSDAYGIQREGSIMLQPQMLPVTTSSELFEDGNISAHGILIMGGLGEIGVLAGLWSSLRQSRHIILASRSGHPSVQIEVKVASIDYVTTVRCDVASTEEAIHPSSMESATVLRSIMHAGELTHWHQRHILHVYCEIAYAEGR